MTSWDGGMELRDLAPPPPHALRKGTSFLIMLTAWWIWKLRNTVVFEAAIPNTASLSNTIRDEARSWASAGAIGIRALIPTAV
jgi:hypothetical protein